MILNGCDVILEDRIIEGGAIATDGERIRCVSAHPMEGDAVDLRGCYAVPGFVDIHCHGSAEAWFFDEPEKAAQWHLRQGTTSMLCSMWRNAGKYGYDRALENVKRAMEKGGNIRGVHMEGPYLDPEYGCEGGIPYPVNKEEYTALMKTGIIRTWTFDPEQEGAEEFAACAQRAGIRLAVCYSRAKPETLERYLDYGLSIGSHILCATGRPEAMFRGTKEPGSDEFVLCDDRMTAEVICDSMGGHVRPYWLKLIKKCKGADRMALVSDCCAGGDTHGSDINVINGELYGSQLTLSVAIRNMRRHTGTDIVELMRMASTTPARTIGIYGERGSIAPGKMADIVILDRELNVCGVLLEGRFVRRDF